jgi:hypothetical protein
LININTIIAYVKKKSYMHESYLKFEKVTPTGASPGALNGEYPSGDAEVPLLYSPRPVVKYLLSVQLEAKAVPVRLQCLPLYVVLPTLP